MVRACPRKKYFRFTVDHCVSKVKGGAVASCFFLPRILGIVLGLVIGLLRPRSFSMIMPKRHLKGYQINNPRTLINSLTLRPVPYPAAVLVFKTLSHDQKFD